MNNSRFIIRGHIESKKDILENIVTYLYNNPETSFNEEAASSFLCKILDEKGFEVKSNLYGIKNSFIGIYGKGSPRIGYICEYDAIEGIGHGSGHNISSAINIGAALGLRDLVDEIGGSVAVIGCPAEEEYPMKIKMYACGVFQNIDAIICGHAREKTSESGSSLGMTVLDIKFKGVEAHSSINFKMGINALYPCVMLFNLVETIKSRYLNSFINGIIKEGGKEINIIPGEARCMFMIKSQDKKTIDSICEEIINCVKFSSKLYSCDFEYSYPEAEYMPLKTHEKLSTIICHNLKENGIVDIHGPIVVPESLDIGNISHNIPTVHPYIGICLENVQYFSKEFSDNTITVYAKDRMLKAACALGITGIDIIQKPETLQ